MPLCSSSSLFKGLLLYLLLLLPRQLVSAQKKFGQNLFQSWFLALSKENHFTGKNQSDLEYLTVFIPANLTGK
jgi:hypothetical protein